MIGYIGDENFQAIDYIGTDKQKQKNKITHAAETQKKTQKSWPS